MFLVLVQLCWCYMLSTARAKP
uniref:Uncharacterized protein n=1 Tax=Rhizophora mucronata TaxID=61149 RepID=A0A2P2QGE5_RHIMU